MPPPAPSQPASAGRPGSADAAPPGASRAQRVSGALLQLVFPVSLFVAAGTPRWWQGWLFVGTISAYGLAQWIYLRRHDPQLLEERAAPATATLPRSERLFVAAFVPTVLTWLPVVGLDAVRFGWSRVPLWAELAAGVALLASLRLMFAVVRCNTFASSVVRVQAERDHHVVDTGPYAVVRHPMYAAGSLMFVSASLMMGSYLGCGVALLLTLLLAARSVHEERALRAGLEGYAAYLDRVRYRLIPHIW